MSATAFVFEEQEVHRKVARIETLIEELGSATDPATRAVAEEVIGAVLDLHGAALDRILSMVVVTGEQGDSLLAEFAADDLVSNVLLLHGLHPVDLRTRVEGALDSVRPYMLSHGGGVELVEVSGDVVRLRLQGSCHGCPSSAMTLKLAVEKAIMEAAPDVSAIEVADAPEEGVGPAQPLRQLPMAPVGAGAMGQGSRDSGSGNRAGGNGLPGLPTVGPSVPWLDPGPPAAADHRGNGMPKPPRVGPVPPPSGEWEVVAEARTVADGEVRSMTIAKLEVVVCRLGDSLFAYEARCPGCGTGLGDALLADDQITCGVCASSFAVRRAGRSSDGALQLTPLPLLNEPQSVRIAIPTAVR